ncbi:MAG TPA: ABC-2 family transporter protein [Gaiellaceae bacterium]|nr:ABC-2 family transporter protein [Gaiellaceae bacterium]
MRLDWEIAKRGWRRHAAYPGATAAGVFTNTIFGFIQAYILLAVFRHRTQVGTYDASDAVTYVWLAQGLLMTVYAFGWTELALRIRDGSIATDLSRPLDPQRYWLAFDLGRAPYHLIFRGLLPFAVGAAVFQLHYPSPLDLAAFFVSVVLAVVVSLAFRFLYNSAAFWFVDIRGVVTLALTVSLFFSGMILPLTFFPSWLRAIAYALPFASIMQTPIDVWLGKHHGAELVGILALQAVWALALLAAGRLTLRLGAKKLVIQGG